MKEPGQVAYEAWANAVGLKIGWPAEMSPNAWAAVEAAVIEECAKVMDEREAFYRQKADQDRDDYQNTLTRYDNDINMADACQIGAIEIRALANPSPAAPE
jgi:hypothetical protein